MKKNISDSSHRGSCEISISYTDIPGKIRDRMHRVQKESSIIHHKNVSALSSPTIFSRYAFAYLLLEEGAI